MKRFITSLLQKFLNHLQTNPEKMQFHFEDGALVCSSNGFIYKIAEDQEYRHLNEPMGYNVMVFKKGDDKPIRVDYETDFETAYSAIEFLVFLCEKNTQQCFADEAFDGDRIDLCTENIAKCI